MSLDQEIDVLKSEMFGLFRYMQRVRQEVAAIHNPHDAEHRFESMGDQLDAIVESTEEATNTIMSAVEANEDIIRALRAAMTDEAQIAQLDGMTDNIGKIYEACSFQDITGQRITKVVKSLSYVENRVNSIIEVWGEDEIAILEVAPAHVKTEDEKLLDGPQRKDAAISQDDIDKLFD